MAETRRAPIASPMRFATRRRPTGPLLFAALLLTSLPQNTEAAGGEQEPPTCLGVLATIVGTQNSEEIVGTDGDDVIVGGNGQDIIFGLAGNDIICGENGADLIFGGDGDDAILGGNGADQILGGHGDDSVAGDRGDDLLDGGPGTDDLDGGLGSDSCARGEVVANCEVPVPNRPPVADAGPDLNATVEVPIALDGSESHDPDGDLITFAWTLVSAPAGSTAVLAAVDVPQPVLVPDVAGDYVFDLMVADAGSSSPVDSMTLTAFDGGSPPNARAGRDREAIVGLPVELDGSGSSDPDGTPLSFGWALGSVPAGSTLTDADITGADTATPSFVPDTAGSFLLNLTVADAGLFDTDNVEVLVKVLDSGPHADAGLDFAVPSSQTVVLDGSASSDPDAGPDPLSYDWTLVSRPIASALVDGDLMDPSSSMASVLPDVEGPYVFRLAVSDRSGIDPGDPDADVPPRFSEPRFDAENVVVYVDDGPPSVDFLQPLDGDTLDYDLPDFAITYTDDLSGLDLSTFQLIVNGADVTADAVVTTSFAFYTPPTPLPDGPNTAQATIADRAGNSRTATINFTVEVEVFRAIADCSPTAGTVPLTVRFVTRGEFSGGSIVRYRWDFDGNGVFDTNDPVARDYTRTFTTAGTRIALLQVTNNFGETATDTCTIVVSGSPPTAVADAVPSNGPAPLTVNFTCTGSDSDGTIALYEWDFEGDGVFDFSSPTSGSTTHTYPVEGQFDALCRVTDNDGLTGSARTTNTVIRPGPPGSPTVTATASPVSGNAPLSVALNGSAVDDGTIVLWEWDFDGDGVFDFSSPTSPATSHVYADGGIFAAALRATDDAGLTGTDNVEIVVNISASLSIPDDTFDPGVGETAAVNTSIGGGVPVRIVIKDRDRTIRRTLVDEFRPAGSYSDVWDGTDDGGLALPSGPYFAVLEYDFAGEIRTVDLTDTTGGTRYSPSRNRLPSIFRPYADDMLDITFTIPSSRGASEVTAFVGLFRVDTRFVDLLSREPLGVGSHTILWDGTAPGAGGIAMPPPGDRFLFGIFGFTLPDNAIMVQTAPTLSGVSVEPNFFDPSTKQVLSPDAPTAVMTYTLDKTADVVLTVTNLETEAVIRTIVDTNVPPASGLTISWDGRADNGRFADVGDYRLTLQAVDSVGSESLLRFGLVKVFY